MDHKKQNVIIGSYTSMVKTIEEYYLTNVTHQNTNNEIMS